MGGNPSLFENLKILLINKKTREKKCKIEQNHHPCFIFCFSLLSSRNCIFLSNKIQTHA